MAVSALDRHDDLNSLKVYESPLYAALLMFNIQGGFMFI